MIISKAFGVSIRLSIVHRRRRRLRNRRILNNKKNKNSWRESLTLLVRYCWERRRLEEEVVVRFILFVGSFSSAQNNKNSLTKAPQCLYSILMRLSSMLSIRVSVCVCAESLLTFLAFFLKFIIECYYFMSMNSLWATCSW